MHETHPLLLAVQFGPVRQPGRGSGRRAGDPGRDQHARGPRRPGQQVEQRRRGPAPDGQLDQRRVGGLAERDAVQQVGRAAAAQRPAYRPGQRGGGAVEDAGVSIRSASATGRGSGVAQPPRSGLVLLLLGGSPAPRGLLAPRENGRGREGLTSSPYPVPGRPYRPAASVLWHI